MSTPTAPSDGSIYGQRPQPPLEPIIATASLACNLINNSAVADQSPWVEFSPFSRGAVEVSGTGGTVAVQLYGSLADVQPALTDSGLSIGSSIAANGITFIDYPGIRWIRAVISDPSTGTVNVNLSVVTS